MTCIALASFAHPREAGPGWQRCHILATLSGSRWPPLATLPEFGNLATFGNLAKFWPPWANRRTAAAARSSFRPATPSEKILKKFSQLTLPHLKAMFRVGGLKMRQSAIPVCLRRHELANFQIQVRFGWFASAADVSLYVRD